MAYKKDSIKKPLSFATTDSLKTRIENQAKKEFRTRNQLIEYACKFYLEIAESKS